MSMFTLLSAPECFPFSVALVVMVGMALLEGVSSLLGFTASSVLDGLVPEIDFDIDADIDVDVDADADIDAIAGPGMFTQTLSWLRVGRVPMLVLLVVFLAAFGLIGLALQSVMLSSVGAMLPAFVMVIPAFILSLPVVRIFGGALASVLPKEETSAVSEKSFVGRIGRIVLGTARLSEPAQARLHDEHGRPHYVMVEPEEEGEEFQTGEAVLLVRVEGSRFRITRPSSEALIEHGNN